MRTERRQALFVVVMMIGILFVDADYQLEIRLLNYTNPGGRTDSGACCEPEAEHQNTCLDPCDTQFTIIVENFRQAESLGSPVVLEEFSNTDSISFPSCGVIGGIQNPLVVTFSASDYNIEQDPLRVTTNIADVDIHPISRLKTTTPITSVVFDISRRILSETFTNITLRGATLVNLQLMVQYRLICTPRSCGPTCSQTTCCTSIPPACPTGCACMNGGTCQAGICNSTALQTSSRCITMSPTLDSMLNIDPTPLQKSVPLIDYSNSADQTRILTPTITGFSGEPTVMQHVRTKETPTPLSGLTPTNLAAPTLTGFSGEPMVFATVSTTTQQMGFQETPPTLSRPPTNLAGYVLTIVGSLISLLVGVVCGIICTIAVMYCASLKTRRKGRCKSNFNLPPKDSQRIELALAVVAKSDEDVTSLLMELIHENPA